MKNVLLILSVMVLICTSAFAAQITLQWDDDANVAGMVDKYIVYQSTNGADFSPAAEVPYPTKTATLNLTPGVYYFRVTAANVWGESSPSNTVQTPAGIPSPPSNVKVIIVALAGAGAFLGLLLLGWFSRKK